jgi:predicted dehydrogenase
MPDRNRRLRVAIVGAGNIAALNVPGYLRHPRCQVVAVCDIDEDRARALARDIGVDRVYTDLAELLADPEVDAVEILTPTDLHYAHVSAALAAGKHVSCQKPLCNSIEEGKRLAVAADLAGLTLRVSECFRHYPPLERAKALIDDGAIGRLSHIRVRTVVGQTDSAFQAGLQADGYEWRLDERSPGGHLFDDMIHKYAMALWLAGQDVTSVQAIVRRRDLFFEPSVAIFEYEDPQLLGSMEVSYAPSMWLRSQYYGADEFFEIQGDEGFLWVTRCTGELLDLAPLMLYQGADGAGALQAVPDIEADWSVGFDRSAAHFVDSVLDDTPPAMTATEAVKALQLCFAVYEAGNSGSAVDPRRVTGTITPEGWAQW